MLNLFQRDTVHIQFYSNKIGLRVLSKSLEIIESSPSNFSNNRLVLADYVVAENFIISLLKKLSQQKRISKNFNFFIQIMEKMEGGISPVEKRAFLDLGEHCGGIKVIVYDKPNFISDSEIKIRLK